MLAVPEANSGHAAAAMTKLLVGVAVFIIVQWPGVNWDRLEWAAPVAMIALPIILFPFTKLLWLAADIAMRPVTPAELEWHRTADARFSTVRETPRQRDGAGGAGGDG